MKSMQNEKVPATNGRSKNFEGHMISKSKIVKNDWKYVTFLTTQNRHVRQTVGIVQRAQRSKIEEILLEFINRYVAFLAGWR